VTGGNCPSLSLLSGMSLAGTLNAMDCNVAQTVNSSFDRLFGQGGAFGNVLTALLGIYVAVLAYGFLTGRTSLTISALSPKITGMILVVTFVGTWPAYNAVFVGLLMKGPNEVATVILGQHGNGMLNFTHGLDQLFDRFLEAARAFNHRGSMMAQSATSTQPDVILGLAETKSMPVTLFWLSGLLLILTTFGALIVARMVLYVLLVVGPIFIALGLFPQTRGLFNGWLRTSVAFAIAPMLTVLGGSAALSVFTPLVDSIADDPLKALQAVQPIVVLFMGSLIYFAFVIVLIWVATSLAGNWHPTGRDPKAESPPQLQPVPSLANPPIPGSVPASHRLPNGVGQGRTETLVAAVSREASGNSSQGETRIRELDLNSPEDRSRASQSNATRFSRVQGLGQRFRTTRPPPREVKP